METILACASYHSKELIDAYEKDVQFPNVSGMEHLDMLMTRSDIAQNEVHLSDKERSRVLKADQLLLQQAEQFYESIQRIADLSSWRRDENAPVTHWWWYLDVIVLMPARLELLPHPNWNYPMFSLSGCFGQRTSFIYVNISSVKI